MTLDEIDALIADGHKRLAPLEVHPDVRQEAMAAGEVGMYPGDEAVLPKFQQAGKKEFEALRTDRLALTDQVKKARIQEKQFRDQDSFLGQAKQAFSNIFTPDEVVQPAAPNVPSPVQPKPLATQPKPAVTAPPMSAPMATGKLPSFKDQNEEEAFLTWYGNKAVDEGLPRHPNHDPKTDYRKQFLEAQGLSANEHPGYGLREDGTPKGKGFFGEIPSKDPAFAQGAVSTELSATAEVDGKELFFPLLVPTLTRQEIDTLLSGQKPTDAIYDKAIAHAQQRIAQGKDPFAGEGEQGPLPTDAPEQPLEVPEVHVVGERIPQNGPLIFTDKSGNVTRQVPTPDMLVAPAGPPMPKSLGEGLTQATNNFFTGIAQIPADSLKAIAIASKTLDDYVPNALKDDRKIEERLTYKLGNTIDQLAKRLFPTDPEMRKNFIVGVLPQAMGSMVGFMAGGFAGMAAKAPGTVTAVLGAGVGGAQQFEEAKDFKASPAVQQKAFWLGSAVGSSEALPIAGLLNRFNKATGGGFVKILKEGGVTAAQEFIQEWFQQVGSNAVAQQLYDENRSWFEGAGMAGSAGGVTGMVVGFLSGVLQGRKSRREHQNESATQNSSPFAGEPKPQPTVDLSGLPQEMQIAPPTQRPPFLIKQQPSQAAPELPPAMVPTSPEQAPVLSQEGGRPLADAPMAQDLGAPETTPLPPSLAPVLESPSQAPAAPAMTPEEIVPGADPSDIAQPAMSNTQAPVDTPAELTDRKASEPEPSVLVGDANFKEGERVSFEQNGKTMTGTIMAYRGDELDIEVEQPSPLGGKPLIRRESVNVANPTLQRLDTKAVLTPENVVQGERPIESDAEFDAKHKRVTDFAKNSALPDHAKQAIISQERMLDTNKGIDAHLTDADWETVTVPIDELRNKNAALWSGKFTHRGSMSKGPIVLDRDGEIIDGNNRTFEAIQRGDKTIEAYRPVDASTASSGQTPDEIIKQRGYDLAGKPLTPENIVDQAAHEAATSPQNDVPTPTEAMTSGTAKIESKVDQPVRDRILADAKLFGDGPDAQTILSKGFQSLSRNRQHMVLSQVRSLLNDDKIFRAVVESVPVDVMNMLMGKKGAAKNALHDKSVLTHRLTVPRNVPVLQPVRRFIDALASIVKRGSANIATEETGLDLSPGATKLPDNATGAVEASGRNGRHAEDNTSTPGEMEAGNTPGPKNTATPGNIEYTVQSLRPGATPETLSVPAKPATSGEVAVPPALRTPPADPWKYAEYVPVDTLTKMREFDRGKEPVRSPSEMQALKKSMQKSGIQEPLVALYHPETNKVILAEGNHRLAIAASLGMKSLPVRIERSSYDRSEESSLPVSGYSDPQNTPMHLRPSEIGLPIFKSDARPITPDTVATQPTKGAIIDQAPTPEEATNAQPQQPRVEDTRPPEGISPEDVSAVEGSGKPESARPRPAKPSRRPTDNAGASGVSTSRSDGDAEGSDIPPDRGGRAESGGDAAIVPGQPGSDFILTDTYELPTGQKGKYKANIDAIKLLKRIEVEGRLASPDEQATLAQYTGWGGLPQAFQWSQAWQKEFSELRELLTEEEYAAARASTPNAHYTDPATIRAIYRGLDHLGFKGGRVLEPGAGVGHFFGAMPAKLVARSQRTAIERDSLSARLAKQLYQRANVIHGEYQSSVLPDNFFDVAVGNVPFADVKIFDQHNKELSKLHLSLHDYYFAKALSQVRPGGIVAFITSRYTMDKVNGKMRDYIATKADLLGAIRLPNTQFKAIANTDVTTDIIVLQRREDGTPAAGQAWVTVDKVQAGNEEVVVNQYFKAHPEQIMGKLSTQGSMYRDNEITVENDGRDMDQSLDEAFKRLPEKVLRPRQQPKSTTARGLLEALEANDDVKDGAYTIQNNALYVRRGNQFVPMEGTTPTDLERAKGLIGIRDQVREVFKTQLGDVGELAMKGARDTLNKQYDRFVKKFGPINGRANKSLFREDPDYGTLQALEKKYDPKTNTAKKADIFSKRVIEYRPKALKAESPKEAMLVSMNDTGRIDWDRMQELTGQAPEAMQQELKGIIYKNPSGEWESADSYLSGNIRAKLKAAEAATKIDKQYQENVDALKAVIPEDLKPAQIDVKLGHGWIPTDVYQKFASHLLGSSRVHINYNAHVGAYAVDIAAGLGNTANDTTFGTGRYKATALIADALASKLPTVYDVTEDEKRIVNEKETLAAREKLHKIQEEFKKWLWSDEKRATDLARLYNDEFNNVRLRNYDGSHLTLPGANPLITLRPHQKNSIWRALQSGNTLLAHVVGAGKTYTMIGIAMEARRLRMANKPMIVVPNHLVEQWRDAFLQLYPAAKVLMPAKDDFKAENRKKLVGRIATGDWDAVVVAHSQLAKVPVSVETFEQFVDEQVTILDEYLTELKQDKGRNRNVIKEIEKSKERLLAKLKARKAAIAERSDTGVNFEETGVDMLMVDEADLFKNLWFPTRMTRVAGLPNTESQRAYDLFLKTQYLNKITNQRGVMFATGTPISNSMAEAFTMQRYLQPNVLESAGLQHFDSWARQFGNTVTSMELAPDGSGYRPRTRFAEFVNVPELTQMFRQVMDVKDQDDLKLPVPKFRTGKPINVVAKPSQALIDYTKSLIERAAKLKSGRVDPRVDNMLKITGDGRNAALDVRLRVPGAPEDHSGKVPMAINNIAEEYTKSNAVKGTQLVFLDLSTPKGEGKAKKSQVDVGDEDAAQPEVELEEESRLRGSVYQDIKRKLVKKGIPEKEIAFIHDADTDAKKSKLFADVNAGTVRVLIGSTEKMGAGTNVQERLVAIHNLDAPWRPRDLEQRIGRGIRQGNKLYDADPDNFEMAVYNYATEAPSFDVYMWQTLEVKAKTITQIMKGDPNIRTIQDVDSAVLSYAEMKAIASGNPLILERVKMETELRKLTLLKSAFEENKYTLRSRLNVIPETIRAEQKELEQLAESAEIIDKHPADPFSIRLDKTTYEDKEAAGAELIRLAQAAIDENPKSRSDVLRYPGIGTYRGFPLKMSVHIDNSVYFDLGPGKAIQSSSFYLPDVKPANVTLRLDNAIARVDELIGAGKRKIQAAEQRKIDLTAELAKPFEDDARIADLTAKMAAIDKKLDLSQQDENVMGGEGSTDTKKPEKPDDGPLGILKSERGSIPASLFSREKGPKYEQDAKAYREQRLKEERGFASSDESIEARVRAAKQGVQPGALWPRLKEHLNHVWHLVSREYEHLPDTAEFSPLRTDLLRLQKYKGIAADQTQRELAAIVKPLDKKQYDQFEWKALLSDLKREAEEERALPFGYTPEKVQEDLDRLDEIIERDPKVRDAWAKRQALWARLKGEYQKSMDAIGFDTSKKLTKTDYFRHQVLEYARERHLKGTGSRVRTPTGRGFLKVRQGSSMDINANYVQAEFEVMAQMVYDTQLAKVIRNVDRRYNIRKSLEQEAKAQNNESLQRIIDEGGLRGALVEGNMKDFRKRIGMHMGMLRKALELEKGDPLSMEDIAEMAGDPDSPGNLSSRGILKAISERKAFVKETLGREFVTADDLIPDTHEAWPPREGNIFYMADSIPAQMARALQEGMLEEAGMMTDKIRKILVMGKEREHYIIPKEAKATLDDLSHKEHSWFVEMNRQLLGHWKQLMLIAPRKVLRYNIRNLTGDADAMFVGNPSAFKKVPAASKDLVPVIFDDKPLTGEAKEWAQRGGYGTTMQMQELGELNDLEAFKATLERESKGGWLKAPAAVWNKYWKAARLGTDYREALMRYAAYLDYLEQMREGNGKPKNYGASIPETVMALPDVRDRAFKLSNELLGAYDRVSVAGQTIRSFWIPFWSWQEVNASRYYRMMRNAFDSGDTGSKLRGATVTTKQAAAFLVKASLMWATLQAWNYLMYGDDEDELKDANPTVANRPHILFGRSDDGKIRYLAGIGALGDLLAWFGLDEFPGLVGDLMHDRMTIGEALKRSAKAPLLKIVGGLTPLVKMPAELLTRQSFYPDPLNPRPIQDRNDYLADQTTFGPEIKAARGKPGKPLYGGDDLTGLLVQRTDPKAAAYSTWQGIEKKYLERMGKESSSVFWRSPRGQALANWSRAIADHDEKAEAHYKAEYEQIEREKYGYKFSQTKMWKDIEQSLRAKAPLAGVTIAERNAIVKELDEQEQRTLHKAETYYRDTLLSVLPEVRRRSFAHKLERKGWLTREPVGMTPETVMP